MNVINETIFIVNDLLPSLNLMPWKIILRTDSAALISFRDLFCFIIIWQFCIVFGRLKRLERDNRPFVYIAILIPKAGSQRRTDVIEFWLLRVHHHLVRKAESTLSALAGKAQWRAAFLPAPVPQDTQLRATRALGIHPSRLNSSFQIIAWGRHWESGPLAK